MYLGDQIKEYGMGWTCSMHLNEKCLQNIFELPESKGGRYAPNVLNG